MKSNLLRDFSVDRENKKIRVTREFAAPLSNVWAAWTDSTLLDQWWGPKPWRAQTKEMDFREGGHWLYAMVGPNGEMHWSRADYESIVSLKSYLFKNSFCDEHGTVNEASGFPGSVWSNRFEEIPGGTVVSVDISFDALTDLEKLVEMGFKEGLTRGMEQLDALLEA